MTPFFLLLAAFALLHLPGLGRWPGGSRPADTAGGALGLVLLLPGIMHLATPERFLPMIPASWPRPDLFVLGSGLAELVVAGLLLVPATRRLGGWLGVLLFLAIWPANIHAALTAQAGAGFASSPLYLWLRVPFQLLYIGWAAWVGLGHLPGLGFRRRMMARFYDRIMKDYEAWIAPRRKHLLADSGGTVLELGPGTGVNFAYLPKDIRWIGLEPNRYMHARLLARATDHGIDASCRVAGAEGMDVADASVDTVISTLVLCSVPDPATVLEEIQRVLKPGGRFVFLEHVAAPRSSPLRRRQRMLRPLWQFCADGCTVDREIDALIRGAGFADVTIEAFDAPPEASPAFVSPHVSGVAVVDA